MDRTNDTKKVENKTKCFLKWENWTKKVIKMEDAKKRQKNREWKKEDRKKEENMIKGKTPAAFARKWDIFQKSKDVKKKKRYRNWTQKRCEAQFKIEKKKTFHKNTKIWSKEINKGIERKNKETFQNEGFSLMVQEGWKKHKTGDAKGGKTSKKKYIEKRKQEKRDEPESKDQNKAKREDKTRGVQARKFERGKKKQRRNTKRSVSKWNRENLFLWKKDKRLKKKKTRISQRGDTFFFCQPEYEEGEKHFSWWRFKQR